MAIVDLPDFPVQRALRWRQRDFGSTVRGALGGADQRANRLGNRWIVTVAMPRMSVREAREWAMKLAAGVEAGGVSFLVRQIDLATGSPGAAVVDGAGQSGKALALRGLTPGYVGQIGQFASVTTGARRYGFRFSAPLRADARGEAIAAIEPGLRAEPGDGDAVALAGARIEGLLADLPEDVTDVSLLAEGFSFTIEEAR